MKALTDINILFAEISKIKSNSNSFVSNFFPDKDKLAQWINKNKLFSDVFNNSFFLYRKEDEFCHLSFFSTNIHELEHDLKTINTQNETLIIDVVANMEQAGEIGKSIAKCNFAPYVSLQRMSVLTSNVIQNQEFNNVQFSSGQDCESISNILHRHFDKFCEQIPDMDEIKSFHNKNSILVIKDEEKIAGFIIFEIKGFTSYLRYWFVDENYRNKKIGSQLISKFFELSANTKRIIFWVIQSNENAIKRYKHYGFTEENLVDHVFSNKSNLSYGK